MVLPCVMACDGMQCIQQASVVTPVCVVCPLSSECVMYVCMCSCCLQTACTLPQWRSREAVFLPLRSSSARYSLRYIFMFVILALCMYVCMYVHAYVHTFIRVSYYVFILYIHTYICIFCQSWPPSVADNS